MQVSRHLLATPAASPAAGSSSSLWKGAANEVGVGVAAGLAALFVFFCVRHRRTARKDNLNTAARRVE